MVIAQRCTFNKYVLRDKASFSGEAKSTSALIRKKIGLKFVVLCKSNILTNVNVIFQSSPNTLFTIEYPYSAMCFFELQLINLTCSRNKHMMPRTVAFLQLVVEDHGELEYGGKMAWHP